MSAEHYFSQTPDSEFKPKQIQVKLAGQTVTVETAGGVFSPEHLDQGTAALLSHLDSAPASGNVLDIGCGWGPIAIALALQSPKATIWAIDVNERSLDLTQRNAASLGLNNVRVCKPEDVDQAIEFSGIWSNPPIRVGKEQLHAILNAWIPRLAPHGQAFLVVQKNLGADSLMRWLNETQPTFRTERLDSQKGFRVLNTSRR
ncbi:MAG: hypothetical protein RLZZ400_721 [Actinomycetota bacterium]|jgi:16S rRNA G1207 methylase RsmC